MTVFAPGVRAASQELFEELMGAVVALNFFIEALMDLPADAFPGGDMSEGIRELMIASACHGVDSVGEEAARMATSLIQAVVERIADDVHAAADLAAVAGQRPC